MMEPHERSPFMSFDQKSDGEFIITMWAMGLRPDGSSAKDCKNGVADVVFFNKGEGMDAKIEVNETKTTSVVWRSIIRKFPSKIEKNKSHWRVEKDKVIITLVKKKIKGEDKYLDWNPLVRENGLDQFKEVEDVRRAPGTIFMEEGLPVTNITILDIDRSKYTFEWGSRKPP